MIFIPYRMVFDAVHLYQQRLKKLQDEQYFYSFIILSRSTVYKFESAIAGVNSTNEGFYLHFSHIAETKKRALI